MNFHGLSLNAITQAAISAMDAHADANRYAVAYPEGLFGSWNGAGPLCCGQSGLANVDDVGFSRAVVEHASTLVCIDPSRVYATGMSAGGVMASRLACDAADLFAAVATVAGPLTLPAEACAPSRPVPIVHFHGTGDQVAPYLGGLTPPAPATLSAWADRNGCAGAPVETFRNGDAHCDAFTSCAGGAAVALCTIDGGGHCWPGGTPPCLYGNLSASISATADAWSFLQRFTLP